MAQDTPTAADSAPVTYEDLPKVSLHDHLDGGLRPETLIEIAAEIGHELPATDADELAVWFHESADSGSLVRYLETFDHTIAVMQRAEDLERVAREFVEDLAEDGVVYGEIRWAPEQHLTQGLSLDEAVDAVQRGIEAGVEAAALAGRTIRAGQILCAMRHTERGTEIAELALRHRGQGVVGFDIAGPEDGFPPSRFAEAFELLAREHFPVTVHAGEAAGLDSIEDALFTGRALRLGHGVRIAEDIEVSFEGEDEDGAPRAIADLGPLASWVRDRQIPLEVCPSSNLQTGALATLADSAAEAHEPESHPIDMLVQLGFAVTVSPDNRLMGDITLSDEFELLADVFDYEAEDFLELTLTAARAAFLPLEDRDALEDHIRSEYARLGLVDL
ncbi:adenosine deaminase [Falsarthrobacter nasiphocae]|uniref:adenosine deaminase n=1 Tax=Falsarthrobacter nasiphocae TaxID=189863 RepID=UPI00286CFDFD|nr:adenosine deaminase [Falsarthrobacter nasiphocae]